MIEPTWKCDRRVAGALSTGAISYGRENGSCQKDVIMKPFVQKVQQIIEEFAMIESKDSVLVAVSGGPDSVALLHAMIELAGDYHARLGVAHLNHGLRKAAADRDAEFVAKLADRYHLPVHIHKEDVRQHRRRMSMSLEETARVVRYDFLARVAKTRGYRKIALGHHADDNAESVIMYILRGSGPQGISGISPVRGQIIRPFIRLTRSEIESYLETHRIDYRIDHSNQEDTFERNRIRHQLLPMLRREYNPNISGALNRLAEISRDEENWLRNQLRPFYDRSCTTATPGVVRLSVQALDNIHVAAARRIVRLAIEKIKGDMRRINFRHIEAVISLARRSITTASIDLPDRVRVFRSENAITVCRESKPLRQRPPAETLFPRVDYHLVIPAPRKEPVVVTIDAVSLKLRFSVLSIHQVPDFRSAGQMLAFFDMNRLSFPLTLRSVQPGDRFRPLGTAGRQKVNKFFIDHKIPRAHRSGCPILVSQEHIIWLVGHRIDEYAKVRASTHRVLKVELSLA